MKSLSHVRLFVTPWTVAYQAPPSMGFPRQECWSGLPFPSPGLRMYRILCKFKSKKSKKIQSVSGQKNRTLHQRKHINGKYAHENMFNNTSHLFIVQSLSHAWLLAIPWTAAWQPCLSFTIFFRACSNSCPLSQWCHPTISSSVAHFSSCPESFPTSGSFPRVSSSHQVAKELELQLQHQSFQWIVRVDFL